MKKKNSLAKRPQSLSNLTDILPDANLSWDFLLGNLERLARGFGFARVETPPLEDVALYESLDLETGNVVSFADPDNHRIALRAETLPGLMRAYSERKPVEGQTHSKWHYLSPIVLYSEQQKKFASTWEYGFELFGEYTTLNQVQLISLVWKFMKSIGLENLTLEINSVGQSGHRKDYEEALRGFLQNKKYELCNECVAAMETYPMRVFYCKNLGCKALATEAPQVVDYLDDDCRKEFTDVLEGLDEVGIAYSLNPMLVAKEGSSRVTFTVKYKDERSEYFIGQGSCHEDMIEQLTGKPAPCFGFVGYLEVLRTALQNVPLDAVRTVGDIRTEVFLVPLGDLASKKALRLFSELWDARISVHDHFGNIGVKNQLKMAEAYKATIALIIGQKEAMDDMVILRDVKSGMQEIFQYERIIEEVKKRLGR